MAGLLRALPAILATLASIGATAAVVVEIVPPTPRPLVQPVRPSPMPLPVSGVWHLDEGGNYLRLNAENGSLIWSFRTAPEDRVAVDRLGLVYAAWEGLVGSHPARAPDRSRQVRLPTELDLPPVLEPDRITLAGWDGRYYTLDRTDLSRLWTSERAPASPMTVPVPAGDLLICPWGSSSVAALSRSTGRQIWEVPVDGRPTGLAVAAGRIFVAVGDAGLLALELESGRRLGGLQLEAPTRGRPLALPGAVLTVGRDGVLRAFDPDLTGQIWRRSLTAGTNPAIMAGLVWLPGEDLVGLEASTGRVAYRYSRVTADMRARLQEDLAWSRDELISPELKEEVLRPIPLPLGEILGLEADPSSPALNVSTRRDGTVRLHRFLWTLLEDGPLLQRLWSLEIPPRP